MAKSNALARFVLNVVQGTCFFLLIYYSVFMAKHLDRHYCGRCTISLKLDAEAIKAA